MNTEPGNMRTDWERRQPTFWHWAWPRVRVEIPETIWDFRLGAVVQIDDGYVSIDCKAGQVWHRAFTFFIWLGWITLYFRQTSPHGRLHTYEHAGDRASLNTL